MVSSCPPYLSTWVVIAICTPRSCSTTTYHSDCTTTIARWPARSCYSANSSGTACTRHSASNRPRSSPDTSESNPSHSGSYRPCARGFDLPCRSCPSLFPILPSAALSRSSYRIFVFLVLQISSHVVSSCSSDQWAPSPSRWFAGRVLNWSLWWSPARSLDQRSSDPTFGWLLGLTSTNSSSFETRESPSRLKVHARIGLSSPAVLFVSACFHPTLHLSAWSSHSSFWSWPAEIRARVCGSYS